MIIHVSHLYEIIKHSNAILALSPSELRRQPIPVAYDLIAAIWNDHCPTHKRFTINPATGITPTETTFPLGSIPITIHDFHITLDDCGLGHLRNNQPDYQALTEHVAMTTVHNMKKRHAAQQQRANRQLAQFGMPETPSHHRKRRREDDHHYFPNPSNDESSMPSGSSTAFSEVNSIYPTSYIPLDDDTAMSTPGPQSTNLITSSSDVFAPSDSVPDSDLTATLESLQDFSDFDSSTLSQPLDTETHSTSTFISTSTVEPSI
jgi:hypothetical protein